MTIHLKYPVGATPLDPNEITGLVPDYILTQAELDAAEQFNIQSPPTRLNGSGKAACINFVSLDALPLTLPSGSKHGQFISVPVTTWS